MRSDTKNLSDMKPISVLIPDGGIAPVILSIRTTAIKIAPLITIFVNFWHVLISMR